MRTESHTQRTEVRTGLYICAVWSAVGTGVCMHRAMTTVVSRQSARDGFSRIGRPEAFPGHGGHSGAFGGHSGADTRRGFTLANAPGHEAGTPA
jgi:hypothetical protein